MGRRAGGQVPRVRKKKWSRRRPDGTVERGETAKWYVFYRDADGVPRQVPVSESYDRTVEYGRELVAEAVAARLTGKPPKNPVLGERLTVAEWIDQFERHLATGDRGPEHVALVASRVRRVLDGARTLPQVTADRVEGYLASLKAAGLSAQTRKHYLRAARQFTRWLVKKRALAACPLGEVETPQVKKDRRRVRRAESAEFLAELYRRMRERNKSYRRLTAEERVWLYAVSGATGYRARELSHLTPADFRFDGPDPVVVLPGTMSRPGAPSVRLTKNSDPTVQPIDPALVPALRAFLAARPPDQPVWPGRWCKCKQAGQMLKLDLADARAAWIAEAADAGERARREASTFLAYRDARGRFFDFHALRKTAITSYAKAGNPFANVQKFARHSDPKLTAEVYVDAGLTEIAQGTHRMGLPVPPA